MAKRALITGVSSFAGRKLASQLIADGWDVAGTVHSRVSGVDGVAEHKLDVCDESAIDDLVAAFGPDVVFHLAAIVDTVDTPSVVELHRVNVLGTAAVLEAVKRASSTPRLVFTSSAFVYGRIDDGAVPIEETAPLRPLTPYGSGKVAAEAIVGQYARTGGDAIIARAFQHSGDGHTGAYALSDWAEQLARIEAGEREPQMRVGNLDVERDYLDVTDVAAAYAAIGERGEAGAIYNVCSGEPVSMRALLDGLIAAFGVEVTVETDQSRLRAGDQTQFFGSPARLEQDTGWRRSRSTAEMLAALAAYWRGRVSPQAR